MYSNKKSLFLWSLTYYIEFVQSKISRFCLSFRFTVFVKCTYIFAQMMLAVFPQAFLNLFFSFLLLVNSMDVHFYLFAVSVSTIFLLPSIFSFTVPFVFILSWSSLPFFSVSFLVHSFIHSMILKSMINISIYFK